MPGYPSLIIDRRKFLHNVRYINNICNERGIHVVGVTKAFCAIPEMAELMVEGGIKILADSRIKNLKKIRYIDVPKILLRLPMKSEIKEVVEYSDISLNSEINVIEELSREALKIGKKHGIIIMIDLGDLREGIMEHDVNTFIEKVLRLKGVEIKGIGVNFNCYGGILPTVENLSRLVEIKKEIESKFGINIEMVSGGNSGSLYLVINGKIPKGINQLRIGEAILRGCETSFQKKIQGTFDDIFTFEAEIIELKFKPSVPFGEAGVDAFGNKPVFEDEGDILRAILACGKQDVMINKLIPLDKSVKIIGSSSDHMIVRIINPEVNYKIGNTIQFDPEYGALILACESEYVEKVFV